MRVTIVTPCMNRVDSIAECLESVRRQTYRDIEHIVVDGASVDGTLNVIAGYGHVSQVISEPDRGLYDAINKGIAISTGDVIGILNSDDYLAGGDVIARIVAELERTGCDAVYSDVAFFRPAPTRRITRRYSSAGFTPQALVNGLMPAHPSVYLRAAVYRECGAYRTDYVIAADYEYMIRLFLKRNTSAQYMPLVTVLMREGGVSNRGFKSRWILNEEIIRAFRDNQYSPSRLRLATRYWRKSREFLRSYMDGRNLGQPPAHEPDLDWIRRSPNSDSVRDG